MTIFAIIASSGPLSGGLTADIVAHAEFRHLRVADHLWLVAGGGTAKEVADKLGISEGKKGSAIVLEISSYWGRATPDVWSWVKTNWEATENA